MQIVIVEKRHYIVVQVPMDGWATPVWPGEPFLGLPPFGEVTDGHAAEFEAKQHTSGGLVLEVVLASLAEVAVKARAAAESAESVCAAVPDDLPANEQIPEAAGKVPSVVSGGDLFDASRLAEGNAGAVQHDKGEQDDDDGVGTFITKFAPHVAATICLRGIWVGEPWAWLWLMFVILGIGCRRKLQRRARLRGHVDDAPDSIEKAFSLVIGSAMLGSIFTGLANNNNDYMDFVGFISYRFGGVSAGLVVVFIGRGVVDLLGLGGVVGNWYDLVKVNLLFYLRQWGAV